MPVPCSTSSSCMNLLHTLSNYVRFIKRQFLLISVYISFTNRVINNWNSLPSNTVLAGTLNSFKNLPDKHWKQNICGIR